MAAKLTIYPGEYAPAVPAGAFPMPHLVNRCNFVSRVETGSISFSEHEGPLSIKCAMGGQEWYDVDRARLAVDDGTYLVLNNGQQYASAIEVPPRQMPRQMESFCIWFRDGFAEQALASSRTPVDRLLEEPGVRARHASRAVSFFERITPHDALVSPVLRRIYDAAITDCVTPDWLEEQFHHLIARLLEAQRGVYPEVDSIPGARAATRAELFRRVSRAKDYLDSSLYSNVTLDDLASSAAMSTHHFLRVFKHTYRETPGRYRSRRRMERAADLVAHTETPITDICMDLGFESLGTFSGKFRKVHGASPTEFRARSRTTPTPPII